MIPIEVQIVDLNTVEKALQFHFLFHYASDPQSLHYFTARVDETFSHRGTCQLHNEKR